MWRFARSRTALTKYISGLSNAQTFMSEGKVQFLYTVVRPFQRKRIYDHLMEVDPEGMKDLHRFVRKLFYKRKLAKQLPFKEAVAEMGLVIAEAEYESEGISKVRFVTNHGLLEVIAVMKASGYSTREICKKLNLDPCLVNKVKGPMIERVARTIPEAIVKMADNLVMRDFMDNAVGQGTEVADRIAGRRRKLLLDFYQGEKRPTPVSAGDQKQLGADQSTFFDVEIKEEKTEKGKDKDEDSDVGSSGEN